MKYKLLILMLVMLLCFYGVAAGQDINIPTAEPVYGGYIEAIDAVALDSVTTRVYISTLSANSMFYMDVDHSGSSPVYGTFQTVPDLDEDDNFGFQIRAFAADGNSGHVFVSTSSQGLVSATTIASSIQTIDMTITEDVQVFDGFLFYLVYMGSDTYLYFGTVSSGLMTSKDSIVVTSSSMPGEFRPQILLDPVTNNILIFEAGAPPVIYESSETYDSLTSSSTFSTLSISDLASTGLEYIAAGITPDGRLITAGYSGNSFSSSTYIGYSDSLGDPWATFDLPNIDAGRGSPFVSVAGDSSPYNVYYGRALNTNNADSSYWAIFPSTTVGTHPMDGPVVPDPNNQQVIYMRTDWGFGVSSDGGNINEEHNNGIVAVQVEDLAMDDTKDVAWIATKSGVWNVTNYQTSPVWITTPLWPRGDSTPYNSVATSVTGDTVFVGNSSGRVFRYESAYGSLDGSNFNEIFGTTTYGFSYSTYISSIAINRYSTNEQVVLGLYDQQDPGEAETQAGLFVGEYSGSSWSWQQVTGSPIPSTGANINDVVVTQEDSVTVIYAGAEYHYDATNGTARSVYRLEDDGAGGWIITQDMENSTQNISASITDLHIDSTGNIYACGTDVGGNHPVIYMKETGDSVWQSLTASAAGLPTDLPGFAVTVDDSTGDVYIAVENEIYVLDTLTASWSLYHAYPNGTEINVIYFDELLVGTGTGLYSHSRSSTGVKNINIEAPNEFSLNQNYPNPFNAQTTFTYYINRRDYVSLKIYNILGREINILVNEFQEKGMHTIKYDAKNLVSGIYIYRLQSGASVISGKMLLMK